MGALEKRGRSNLCCVSGAAAGAGGGGRRRGAGGDGNVLCFDWEGSSQMYIPNKMHQTYTSNRCTLLHLPYKSIRLIKIYIWELRGHVREPAVFLQSQLGGGMVPRASLLSLLPSVTHHSSCWIKAWWFQKMHVLLRMNGETYLCHKILGQFSCRDRCRSGWIRVSANGGGREQGLAHIGLWRERGLLGEGS